MSVLRYKQNVPLSFGLGLVHVEFVLDLLVDQVHFIVKVGVLEWFVDTLDANCSLATQMLMCLIQLMIITLMGLYMARVNSRQICFLNLYLSGVFYGYKPCQWLIMLGYWLILVINSDDHTFILQKAVGSIHHRFIWWDLILAPFLLHHNWHLNYD